MANVCRPSRIKYFTLCSEIRNTIPDFEKVNILIVEVHGSGSEILFRNVFRIIFFATRTFFIHSQ